MALTEVKDELLVTFMEGITSAPRMDWEQCFEVRRDDIHSLKLASMSGIGAIPVWSGTGDLPPADFNDRYNTTITYEKYGLEGQLNKYDRMDVPGLEEGAVRKMGIAVGNTMGAIAADRLNDIFDATTTAGDGVALCSDSHPLASGSTRDNLLASAFDRSALMAALNLASLWTSYHGQEEDFSMDDFVFLGSPQDTSLRETFVEVTRSSVSSSQNQTNAAADYRITPLIWQRLTDSQRWALVSRQRTPLVYWIREPAEQTLTVAESSRQLKIGVDFGIGTGVRPDPVGIIGSKTN